MTNKSRRKNIFAYNHFIMFYHIIHVYIIYIFHNYEIRSKFQTKVHINFDAFGLQKSVLFYFDIYSIFIYFLFNTCTI